MGQCAGTGTESRISTTSFGRSPFFFPFRLLGSATADHAVCGGGRGVLTLFRRLEKKTIEIPVLFIQATDDAARESSFFPDFSASPTFYRTLRSPELILRFYVLPP